MCLCTQIVFFPNTFRQYTSHLETFLLDGKVLSRSKSDILHSGQVDCSGFDYEAHLRIRKNVFFNVCQIQQKALRDPSTISYGTADPNSHQFLSGKEWRRMYPSIPTLRDVFTTRWRFLMERKMGFNSTIWRNTDRNRPGV